MDELRISQSSEEISIFCPVRLYLGHRSFDALLDTLDSRGGSFFVLTDDAPANHEADRLALQRERRGELILKGPDREIRIPCQVRGMRFDEEGLHIYVSLRFLIDGEEKRRLETFIASLW